MTATRYQKARNRSNYKMDQHLMQAFALACFVADGLVGFAPTSPTRPDNYGDSPRGSHKMIFTHSPSTLVLNPPSRKPTPSIMPPKPTLILIHGAWHRPSCFDLIVAHLRAQGFKCIAPDMLSAGHEPAVPGLAPDIASVREIIAQETSSGSDVVIFGHSFGGICASSVIRGFSKHDAPAGARAHVLGLLVISAMLLPTGVSQTEHFGVTTSPAPFCARSADGMWMELNYGYDLADAFYHDVPKERAQALVKELRKQAWSTFVNGEGTYAGWRDVPVYYLVCTEDKTFPRPVQDVLVAGARQAGADVTTSEIATSHSPFVSKVDETAAWVIESVEKIVVKDGVPVRGEVGDERPSVDIRQAYRE